MIDFFFILKKSSKYRKNLFFFALYVVCKVKCGFADVQNIQPKTVRTVLYHTSFRVVQYFFNMVTVERFAYHLRAANMCVFSINDVNSLLSISSWVHAICSRVGFFSFVKTSSTKKNRIYKKKVFWKTSKWTDLYVEHIHVQTHSPQLIKTYEHA